MDTSITLDVTKPCDYHLSHKQHVVLKYITKAPGHSAFIHVSYSTDSAAVGLRYTERHTIIGNTPQIENWEIIP